MGRQVEEFQRQVSGIKNIIQELMSRRAFSLNLLATLLILSTMCGVARQADTVRIDASRINTSVLIPGTHRYLVYFKHGKDSSRVLYQMWTRTLAFVKYQGRDAISIKQEWENNSEIFHTVMSYCERKTFTPLYQEHWWKSRGTATFDFIRGSATLNAKSLADATDSAGMSQWNAFAQARKQYVLNWHLDLEVFSTLPFKEGRTFLINYYDPGFSAPAYVPYTVSGTGTLPGYNNQKIECWLLKGKDPRYEEVFWISKTTHEVLKLDEHYGNTYRYKIKLPFSV